VQEDQVKHTSRHGWILSSLADSDNACGTYIRHHTAYSKIYHTQFQNERCAPHPYKVASNQYVSCTYSQFTRELKLPSSLLMNKRFPSGVAIPPYNLMTAASVATADSRVSCACKNNNYHHHHHHHHNNAINNALHKTLQSALGRTCTDTDTDQGYTEIQRQNGYYCKNGVSMYHHARNFAHRTTRNIAASDIGGTIRSKKTKQVLGGKCRLTYPLLQRPRQC
jgi:hypothetical protein